MKRKIVELMYIKVERFKKGKKRNGKKMCNQNSLIKKDKKATNYKTLLMTLRIQT